MTTLSTYDVVAYREQPSGRIFYVIDGDESRLHSRADALRILNP